MSVQLDQLTTALSAASTAVTDAAARVTAALANATPPEDLSGAIQQANDIKIAADAIAPAQP